MSRGRRRYLVSYDVSDPKRLRRLHQTVKGFGWAMQYSVFICDLDQVELYDLRSQITAVMHHAEDRVAIIDLGDPRERGASCFEFLGRRPRLPTQGPVVL